MAIVIKPIGADRLADYATVPMICDVRSTLVVDEINDGMGGLALVEQPLQTPYQKDYDSYADGGPRNWPHRFDISNWGIWLAYENTGIVGGAAVSRGMPSDQTLQSSSDVAVLWDIRVLASNQLQGVGTALFQQAVRWAKSKGCRLLKIETQTVNPGACRFYKKMGCHLSSIDRLAYSHCPQIAGEVMLIWYLDLSS